MYEDGDEEEEEQESPRQLARRLRREAGNRSATASRTLMSLTDGAFRQVELTAKVRAAATAARKVTSHVARRRAERSLAGELRHADLTQLETELDTQKTSGRANAHKFQVAEAWRALLIRDPESGFKALQDEFQGLDPERWVKLIADAQNEAATGKPKGGAKALFRQIMPLMRDEDE